MKQELTGATWIKSSRSSDPELVQCVEVTAIEISHGQPALMTDHDGLLTPSEAARAFGVKSKTLDTWVRRGKITAVRTPGGTRRYRRSEIERLLNPPPPPPPEWVADAVQLYDQGSTIRQVAERFDTSYDVMRRTLTKHTVLRRPGRL